jgi:tRNA-2-methylthio-N6-dimethylallyladenosine synthase
LIEGISKRSADFVYGRNSQNLTVIFPKGNLKPGEYVNVKIEEFTSATVKGTVVS